MKNLVQSRLGYALLFVSLTCGFSHVARAQNPPVSPADFSLYGRVDELDAKAASLIQKGDYAAARAPAAEVVHLRRQISGGPSPDTAIRLDQLGLVEMKLHNFEAARSCFAESAAFYERFWGENNNKTIDALDHLGAVNLALKDYPKVRSCYERVYAYSTKLYGDNSARTVAALDNLNSVLKLIGGDALVETEAVKRDQARTAREPSDDKILIDALNDSYTRHMNSVRNPLAEMPISDKPNRDLARPSRSVNGHFLQAELADAEKTLGWRRRYFGMHDRETANAFSRVGFLYAKRRDYAKAASCYEQARAISTQISGEQSPAALSALDNLRHVRQFIADPAAADVFRRQPSSKHQQDIDPSATRYIGILRQSK